MRAVTPNSRSTEMTSVRRQTKAASVSEGTAFACKRGLTRNEPTIGLPCAMAIMSESNHVSAIAIDVRSWSSECMRGMEVALAAKAILIQREMLASKHSSKNQWYLERSACPWTACKAQYKKLLLPLHAARRHVDHLLTRCSDRFSIERRSSKIRMHVCLMSTALAMCTLLAPG
jgi:hypothetical protein